MAKLGEIRSDLSAESEGVWVDYELGIEVKLSRLRSPAFRKAMEKITRNKRRGKRAGLNAFKDDQEMKEKIVPLLAKHIIRDWKNIEDDDGKPIAFSEAKAVEFLMDDSLEDFYDFIIQQSNASENFRLEEMDDDAGN